MNYFFPGDENVIAVATDEALSTETNLPLLDLNDPDSIATFIYEQILTREITDINMENSDQNNKLNKQNSCMDDFDPDSLMVSDALKKIYTAISPISESETVPIRESLNRILTMDIISSLNVPTATNSAMDGYALHGANIPKKGTSIIKVVGTAFAGKPHQGKIGQGECIRIMTGAVITRCN